MTERSKFRGTLLVLCNGLILAAASPVYMREFSPEEPGRNIRHLPCVSKRTGETGVCMFAFTCFKANGTHLGTCIDRFYFGSCCKIEGEPDIFPHDNTIDDGPVKPYPTNHWSIESNNIPKYSPKPTSTATKSPVRITEAPVKTTQTPTTTQKPVKVVEKPLLATTVASDSKPVKVTVNTTNKRTTTPVPGFTTDSVGLSTFQTVQNNFPKTSSTPRPTSGATSKPPQKVSATVPATTSGKPGTVNKPTSTVKPSRRPTQNGTKIEAKPMYKPTVTVAGGLLTTMVLTTSFTIDKTVTVGSSTTARSTTRPSQPTIASIHTTTHNFIPITAELNMSDYKQVCGRRLIPDARIVGGTSSSFGKWPWQISLRKWRTDTYSHICGAALLNSNWAITAAHCVAEIPVRELLLRLGEYDLASEDEPYGFQERRVQLSAVHPLFDRRTFEYDLALLRFYKPLSPFQPNTLPICLPDDDESYVGLTAHVTGWGRLSDGGPLPSVLQEVPVRIINNTICEDMYATDGVKQILPSTFICAGSRKGGRDACDGDSGGPLVVQRRRDKRWVLAGTVSWGIGCAAPHRPGVYTRISEFRTWINQIIKY